MLNNRSHDRRETTYQQRNFGREIRVRLYLWQNEDFFPLLPSVLCQWSVPDDQIGKVGNCLRPFSIVGTPMPPDLFVNMESRFPAMSVLWLGREFYRSKYGMTGSGQAWTPDLVDELGYFGDEMWDLRNAGIFSVSLLRTDIRIYPDDSM
ncbi:hypothetical protein AVEN_136367-1 [Araneus ventricosus]|uniref:Uncharacterized protein n=1 Tax=Araneus ventricosus TaxID=182803 RepID=A0A4Y2JGV2_ARAVE|nr:hypothetical protein AVEN_136367-1 [Araneus ventricosus]